MDEEPESHQIAREYLKHRNYSGSIIFSMLTGSHAYNLANENSDKDYLAVYVVDTKSLLSIDGDKAVSTVPLASLPGDEVFPDITLYEAKQFLKLIAKGNPFMIEMLFAEKNVASSETWERLRSLRRLVLCKSLVHEFLSYIRGQMAIHKRKGLKGKRIYHVLRLLYELRRIIQGKDPLIDLPEGVERNRLMAIRQIEEPGLAVLDEAEVLIGEIENAQPWNLPDECDEKPLNDWLIQERLSRFVPSLQSN